MSVKCPNCDAALSVAELAGDWCESCGKKIPEFVRSAAPRPPAPPPPMPADVARAMAQFDAIRAAYRPPSRLGRAVGWVFQTFGSWVVFGVLLGVLIGIISVGGWLWGLVRSDVEIFVDNHGGREALVVELDGSRKLTVAPGEVGSFGCRAGTKRVTATAAGKVVFDETKTLESGGRGGRKQYLLNPGGQNRYWERTVSYGASLPSISTYSSDADRYSLIAGRVPLVPAGVWTEVRADHVLAKPPESVSGKYMASRTVVTRIGAADYALIAAAKEMREPKSDDFSRLEAAVERVTKADP